MKLTPLDISKQQFKKVWRGYDRVEVDTFMEMVGNEFEDLLKREKELREKVVELETQLKDYRQIEKTLQQTLLQAQETTGRTYEAARREAEEILREAEAKATRMLEQSTDRLSSMHNDMMQLRGRRASLLARLRLLLTSELELVKALEPGLDDEPTGIPAERESVDLGGLLRTQEDDNAPRQH